MKVFLDVGAHTGETLRAVLNPRFRFDHIICFEPASACWKKLRRFSDPRITVCPFGLSDETGERSLFNPGRLGASVYSKEEEPSNLEKARFVRATDWFRDHLTQGDVVFMKLNCEGSECDILEDLLESGELRKVESMLVHFDVRNFPSLEHREAEVRRKLDRAGIRTLVDARDATGPSPFARIQQWLDNVGASRGSTLNLFQQLRTWLQWLRWYALPTAVRALRLHRLARQLLPRVVYARISSVLLGYKINPNWVTRRTDGRSSGVAVRDGSGSGAARQARTDRPVSERETAPRTYVPPPPFLRRLQRHFRRKRMERFWNQLGITPVTRVLDVGGTPYNWRLVASRPRVILANMKLQLYKRGEAGLSWVIGDGRRLPFRDQAIDVVFCNSVIEHVGGFEDQSLLAAECRRVGRRYWVQTPNKTFPVEPHLMTPFIHWLPRRVQRRLLRNFTLWGLLNRPTEERCDRFMREVRLLSASEMRRLFRDAEIWQERVLGLSKSLVAIKK